MHTHSPYPLPDWARGVHHDGSQVYVSNPTPALGETVTLRLRTPHGAPIERVFLRIEPDGEGHLEKMHLTHSTPVADYWAVELKASMPVNPYRFRLVTTEGVYFYNALGVSRADSPDHYDFRLLADYQAPAWVNDSVFYQIFPDRFHNGDDALTIKPGAWSKGDYTVVVREWGESPQKWQSSGSLDFFGGDLPGILQKLDYLQDLGVTAIYLNPIFSSASNHRYNISDFYNVDPHLGGNEALIALREEMHRRGMRLILDITPNHIGSTHPWFTSAQADPDAPTAEYFTFYNHPDDYEAWLGVRTLPKLNYRSGKLRKVMYKAQDSVLRRWINPPYDIDGWRMDVANMTARQGATQLSRKVWRGIRRAIKQDKPHAYIMGESFFDGTPLLQGDQLDATMNYQGFNILMWRWLAGYDGSWLEGTADTTLIPTEVMAQQMARFYAAIPWVIANQQFNQLCSHDTVRILTIVNGDKARVRLGLAVLMTYPGVPCIYYGDEIGLPGGNDPDNRRTMIWDESQWDHDLRGYYQRLIALRRRAPALRRGGYQVLHAQGDVFAYLRQSPDQALVIVAHRSASARPDYALEVAHGGIEDGATLIDVFDPSRVYTVSGGRVALGDLPADSALVLEVTR